MEHDIWGNLILCSQATSIHIWFQNKQFFIPLRQGLLLGHLHPDEQHTSGQNADPQTHLVRSGGQHPHSGSGNKNHLLRTGHEERERVTLSSVVAVQPETDTEETHLLK